MTKNKWLEIYDRNTKEWLDSVKDNFVENWEHNKKACLTWIEKIDKLTEVYNLENKEN